MTVLHEQDLSTAAALRPWVPTVHVMSVAPSPARIMTRLPNATTSLVLCARAEHDLDLVVAGPNMRASYKQSAQVPFYARFTFRPGTARAFFGVAMHELVDRVVPVDELWGRGADALRGELRRSRRKHDSVRKLESALMRALGVPRVQASRVHLAARAAQAIETSGDGEPEQVHALAARLGVSERQLRQVFREEIGISPKRYARIARIRRVVARAGSARWARLAAESGFYDQAHLNAEFSDLLGVTPRAFLAGELPAGFGCGPK